MTPTVLLALEHLLLLVICITGDKLGAIVQKPPLLRAVIDNITHALIGGLVTEIIVRDYKDQLDRSDQITLIAVGFVASSWIDLDHFIEARSFHLDVILETFFFWSFELLTQIVPPVGRHQPDPPTLLPQLDDLRGTVRLHDHIRNMPAQFAGLVVVFGRLCGILHAPN